MIVTGTPEYKRAVDEELARLTEELQRLHHGDVRYLAWLESTDPGQSKTLAAIPAQIQAVIGLVPLSLFYALTHFLIAAHTVVFESWAARDAIGTEVLARLTAATGWKM